MWKNFIPNTTEEETVNNAFCTNELFRISSESDVVVYPRVQSQVQNKRMLLCIDNSITLMQDENVMECNWLSFGSTIDALAVSHSGNLIVCALADGNIHGIFIKGLPIFNLCVKQEDIGEGGTFVGIKQLEDSYYIICRNGKVYRLFNVDEKLLESYCDETVTENESRLFNETILKNTMLERFPASTLYKNIASFCLFENYAEKVENVGSNLTFVMGDDRFAYFEDGIERFKIAVPDYFQGIKIVYNLEQMIIGLSNSGHLFEICPYTKLLFQSFASEKVEYLIDQFVVLENNEDDIELLLLTKPAGHLENRLMRIVEFPAMYCKSELPMPQHTWLVQQPKTSVNMYYLSGENFNESGFPQEIGMKLMSETQPEERLKKLIHKGRLEEAEEFGKQFNLNLQPICEAKARRKLLEIKLLNENQTNEIEQKFLELLKIFELIENKDFFLSICEAEIPSRSVMEKFLHEILSRLKNQKYQQYIFEIKEQLLRLETLDIIDPYECNMQWQKFVHHPNIAKVCLSLFKMDMLSACLIWKRHAACIIPQLDCGNILKLLNAIPQNTEAFYIVQWLRYFVPSVLQTHPSVMTQLIDWCIQKTRSLQYAIHWPEIGLEFSSNLLNIFEDVQFLFSDVRRQYDSNIDKLKAIVNALQDLSVLKKGYNLILTLDNYVKNSLDETALRILQGVQLNNLKKVTCDFLYPIYLEKGQTPVHAIKKYINFLVSNRKNTTLWLDRAVLSIDLLHNEEEKLQCALLVLKSAPVPWPESLNPLIKLSNSSHPLAAEIHTQYDLQTIKLLKLKYDWPIDAIDSNMKLVFRVVKVGRPEMINDIRDLVKVCPEISGGANFYCCYELARRGDIQKAVQFLDSLEEKQRAECYGKITNILMEMFSNSTGDGSNYEQLFEFLKVITSSCNRENQRLLQDLQNLHLLRTKFDLKVCADDLKNRQNRLKVLVDGIDSIFVNLKKRSQSNIIHFIWNQMIELSNLLNFEKMFGILEFCKKINNLELSCALAYSALNLEEVSMSNHEIYIDLATVLICQHIELITKEADNSIADPLPYPLAYRLLIESLKFGKIFQLEIIEFLKWVRIGNEMYNLNAIEEFYDDFQSIDRKIAESLIGEKSGGKENGLGANNRRESISVFEQVAEKPENNRPVNDPTPITKCVSLSLLGILLELNFEDLPLRLNLFINPEIRSNLEDIKITFLLALEHLVKCKQYNSWYTIVQYMSKYQNFNCLIPMRHITPYKKKMLKFLLSQKDPNFTDLFAMLLTDSNPEVFLQYLENELKVGQPKLNYLVLAEMYHTHIGDDEKILTDRENRTKYYYYTELIKQDSTLKTKTNLEFVSIGMLMKELRNKVLDVSLLKKLSNDFVWDYQQVLVAQIITLLNMQEPSYEMKTDALGKEEIIMKTSTEQIRDLCQPYLNEISNTNLLASKLLQFISEINFYFYELYLCVIDILIYIDSLPKEMELWANMLLFLKHKMVSKRRHRAGQMEMDWWLKSQQEVGVLPKIAKYRFPFQPIVREPLKNILDNEVNVDNCDSWFPLIKLHTMNQDRSSHADVIQEQEYFCMSAVKNSISEYKQQNEESDMDVWHLQPINNAFLQSILRLIRHMTNISKILFILYFVTNHAPEGADQVEAAYECYKFASQHEKQLLSIKKADETVVKIKRKYPIIKTQHLLHIYGLVDDKLLQMAEIPKDLINALYHHESILISPKSDINSVAAEIAELHGLDFHAIQISLLQAWLACASQRDAVDVEETFYEDFNVSVNNVGTVNNENIIRAHYILNSWDSTKAVEFLICHMFPVDGTINTGKQLQMFECFTKLIDETSSSYMDIVSQKQYVELKCVHYLKQLGYNFTPEKFTEYDKLSILKKIWQNHATNPLALEIISYICIGYDIYVPQVWNGVLKQMVNLNLVMKLNSLVDILSCKAELLYTEGLIAAWECVLRAPFKNANRLRSYEQENMLAKNLFRIQACPLLTQLNLIAFTEDCIRLDRPHMAAIFISLANRKQRELIIPVIKQYKRDSLKKEMVDLEEMGISPTVINFAIHVLKL